MVKNAVANSDSFEVSTPSDVAITLWHKERSRVRKRLDSPKEASVQTEVAAGLG